MDKLNNKRFVYLEKFFARLSKIQDENLRLRLNWAICEFGITGKKIDLSSLDDPTGLVESWFDEQCEDILNMANKYNQLVNNGKKGGAPIGNQNAIKKRGGQVGNKNAKKPEAPKRSSSTDNTPKPGQSIEQATGKTTLDLITEYAGVGDWFERLSEEFNQTPEVLANMAEMFAVNDCMNIDKKHSSETDLKAHFRNWLRKAVERGDIDKTGETNELTANLISQKLSANDNWVISLANKNRPQLSAESMLYMISRYAEQLERNNTLPKTMSDFKADAARNIKSFIYRQYNY